MWTPWRRRWRSTGGSGFPCCERGFHPRTPFSLRLCRRKAPMGLDSPVAGRAGKKHVSFRNLAGAPPPDPGLLFSCQKSNQKDIQGGGCFDSPSPLKIPHPQRHTGGRLSPFGIPRRTFQYPVRRWILPQVRRKNYVSPSTNRNISPFNRAVAEASLTTKPQIRCQNEIQWQRCPKSDKDRLGKNTGTGVSPAIFGDFLSLKSHPGPGWGGPGAIESNGTHSEDKLKKGKQV